MPILLCHPQSEYEWDDGQLHEDDFDKQAVFDEGCQGHPLNEEDGRPVDDDGHEQDDGCEYDEADQRPSIAAHVFRRILKIGKIEACRYNSKPRN